MHTVHSYLTVVDFSDYQPLEDASAPVSSSGEY